MIDLYEWFILHVRLFQFIQGFKDLLSSSCLQWLLFRNVVIELSLYHHIVENEASYYTLHVPVQHVYGAQSLSVLDLQMLSAGIVLATFLLLPMISSPNDLIPNGHRHLTEPCSTLNANSRSFKAILPYEHHNSFIEYSHELTLSLAGCGWWQGGAESCKRRSAPPCLELRSCGQPRVQRGKHWFPFSL